MTDEADGGNIYEEIIPPHRRLFLSISQGRRENLSLYKFADWDLEDKLKPKTDQVREGVPFDRKTLTETISG